MSTEVSHGRGGAGNFKPDDTEYVDGEVVRTGIVGSHGDGAYSAGRGACSDSYPTSFLDHGRNQYVDVSFTTGAGNIGDIGTPTTERKDQDIIPEIAIRPSQDGRDFHTGRGGAGNAQVGTPERKSEEEEKPVTKTPVGLADKLKSKIFGHKK
ncbi:hypothetical protein HYE67_009206 [Fusarium culmorum]|uniref:Uncharacterized protein n=3 Tax=Fusarium sambucinum species complex TaxID=569360 RepID=I1RCC1_GIBZE|nr:hypothetical protein FGSG_01224 [Fusarium graminearum PH-1]EYB24343.1 hypothetical protein FG05_01224 [Fusarium graminearum]KAF5245401.1 hypothetical protein FAUST_1776 [Fusarium austroamericanum]PTD13103.1 hypothetical protein FCULG_00003923 [Fusarium culmorum]ESU06513.1 hypothetical protein FGSG_01224 [Fusarium graminearum PH-1]KAI6760243.1 hypothetical protein HG531_013444 [Fusarium graminearum]|eukprot:XP_011316998.1 hypothetical protein FGSG_01224 [Fusarium graminearum PH-1]